jgi:hypothetical protein
MAKKVRYREWYRKGSGLDSVFQDNPNYATIKADFIKKGFKLDSVIQEITTTEGTKSYENLTTGETLGKPEIKPEYIILAAVGIVAVIMIIYFAFGRK